ncbi:colicin v production protein [Bartonella quintana RM-11]|nr:colicin v production protein [Bartonella quintana RM-11]
MLLINALIKPEQQSDWLKNAKTRPFLNSLSQKVWDILPKNLDIVLEKAEQFFKRDDAITNDKHSHENISR